MWLKHVYVCCVRSVTVKLQCLLLLTGKIIIEPTRSSPGFVYRRKRGLRFVCRLNVTNTHYILLILSLEQSSAPPPPPPPLPPVAPPAPPLPEIPKTPNVLKRAPSRQSIKSTVSVESRMQEELSSVLTLVRERTKERHLDIKQTPESYINNKSSPDEVREWLGKKGFSNRIQEKFKGVAGHHLFDIQKDELERICGRDEGKRLFSQLSIQKSISGYQTVRTTELKAILAKARQKIETS